MGRRILVLALWGLVAVFIVRTCFPGEDEADAGVVPDHLESFAEPPPEDYPLVLENALVRTEWSARGASCGRVLLKKYTPDGSVDDPQEAAQIGADDWLVLYDARWVDGKRPADPDAPGVLNYRRRDAFRLVEASDVLLAPDPETDVKPNLDGAEWEVEEFDGGRGLRFSWTAPSGVEVTKSVRLAQDAYHLEADVAAVARDQDVVGQDLLLRLFTGGGIRITEDRFYPNPYVGVGIEAYGQLDDVEFFDPSGKLPASRAVAKRWRASVPFVVEGSKYFMSAIQPLETTFSGAVAEVLFDDLSFARETGYGRGETVTLEDPARSPYWKRASVGGSFTLHLGAVDAMERKRFRWYVGPKDPAVLTTERYGSLGRVVDHADYRRSFFYRIALTSWVAPAILALLKAFHAVVGNWGVAIILLTVLVRALVFPIQRHSQVKMALYQAKMQKVKPQLDAINKKYAKDPQRKQQETLKIYQQHKLSPPLGGCLPMFLQMPIFIGLFAALRSSILLRQEPFALWIDDLARPDALVDFGGPVLGFWPFSSVTTLNLLPILMVVLWVLHMRSMPKPTDPQQQQVQKIMQFMPVMFGLILYNYAAGLSLYMITSSLIGIFEQKVIKKRWPVPQGDAAAAGNAKGK